MSSEQEQVRRERLTALSQLTNPYPERYEITHDLDQARLLEDDISGVRLAGRIVAWRKLGKLTFIAVSNISARFQLALKEDVLGREKYEFFHDLFDIGDFIGAEGTLFTTKTGEKTLRIEAFTPLGKCLKVLPEKWHGLSDIESCYRQRYLDLIMSSRTRERFLFKSAIIKAIRRFLEDEGFVEAETPVLQPKPSGALARPFIAHHEALNREVYLRIAPETYLKRLVVGGFTRVFEFARCFRNEGISQTHLQDFTMLECYAAFWNYKDNMVFTRKMVLHALKEVIGTTVLNFAGKEIDFAQDWPVVTFRELILKDTGLDIDKLKENGALLAAIREKGIVLGHDNPESLSPGNLIDLLYKRVSRPGITTPVFLTSHPIELSPLARANDENPEITDRFQLVINGAEIINAYSELTNPIEQRKRLEQQAQYHAKGDGEAMVQDEDYLAAMEYGMPPASGWGMGIERLVQVLTSSENIKDCVLFPLLRAEPAEKPAF